MDKNAIKKYAVWARNELIARVTQKAEQYEITEKKTTPAEADSIDGRLLSEAEKKQRAALIEKIKTDGFEHYYETFHPDLSRDYRAIYTTTSAYRPELLLHPLEYLWTLGYIRGVVEKQGEPERRVVTYRLYRIKSEKATGVIRH